MDATRLIISEIISQKILENWLYWALFFAVSGLSALVASFISAYASKRGEHLATKADFDSLKRQLEATTRLSEEIKSEVGHIEWRMRETYTTRRAKLEEFVQQMGTVMATIDPWASKMMSGEHTPLQSDCLFRLEMLARLYFPTLRNATLESVRSWQRAIQHAYESCQALSRIDKGDLDAMRRQGEESLRLYAPLYEDVVKRRAALQEQVVTSMQDILQFPDDGPK